MFFFFYFWRMYPWSFGTKSKSVLGMIFCDRGEVNATFMDWNKDFKFTAVLKLLYGSIPSKPSCGQFIQTCDFVHGRRKKTVQNIWQVCIYIYYNEANMLISLWMALFLYCIMSRNSLCSSVEKLKFCYMYVFTAWLHGICTKHNLQEKYC